MSSTDDNGSGELAEHLRFVHFALLLTAGSLLAVLHLNSTTQIGRAKEQLKTLGTVSSFLTKQPNEPWLDGPLAARANLPEWLKAYVERIAAQTGSFKYHSNFLYCTHQFPMNHGSSMPGVNVPLPELPWVLFPASYSERQYNVWKDIYKAPVTLERLQEYTASLAKYDRLFYNLKPYHAALITGARFGTPFHWATLTDASDIANRMKVSHFPSPEVLYGVWPKDAPPPPPGPKLTPQLPKLVIRTKPTAFRTVSVDGEPPQVSGYEWIWIPLEYNERVLNPLEELGKLVGLPLSTEPLAQQFPDLFAVTEHLRHLPLSDLDKAIMALTPSEAERFEAFGVKLPASAVHTWGVIILVGVQVYFVLHLSAFARRLQPSDPAWSIAWIPLYDSVAARFFYFISAILLPITTAIWLVLASWGDRSAVSRGLGVLCSLISVCLGIYSVDRSNLFWKMRPTGVKRTNSDSGCGGY